MDLLKKFFPYSYGAKEVKDLVIKIIVYVVAMVIGGAMLGLVNLVVGWLPLIGGIIGWVLGLVGSLVGIYCLAGIVLLVLDYFKILK